MAERPEQRPGILGSAGRTAAQLLRRTRTRAKLGSLHLPISFTFRPQPILLPVPPEEEATPAPESPSEAGELPAHTRALRGRLGASERRIARLRHALERERQARALAGAALQDPGPLIEQLVADLSALPEPTEGALRETIRAVLAAHGFGDATATPASEPGEAAPVVPGWHRARIEALTTSVLAAHPDIGGRRYLHLALEGLARQGNLTAAQLAASAALTSPLARHRLRLALEALVAEGMAQREGPRFSLLPPAGVSPGYPEGRRRPRARGY